MKCRHHIQGGRVLALFHCQEDAESLLVNSMYNVCLFFSKKGAWGGGGCFFFSFFFLKGSLFRARP